MCSSISGNKERLHLASQDLVQDALAQHLKAAAAAYVAVHVKGRATVELQKDATMLGQRGDFSCRVDGKSRDSNQSAGGFSWLVFLRKVFLTCLFLLPTRGSKVWPLQSRPNNSSRAKLTIWI